MKFVLICLFIFVSNNTFAEPLANLRGQAFHQSATCNIIKAKEILELSTIPFTEKEVPEIRTLIQDTKNARTECFEQVEEIINNLLIDEESLVFQDGSSFILKLQYESDQSFQALLKLRKQVSRSLLEHILNDIEQHFEIPVGMAQFYVESQQTKYLVGLETTLALESERRQVFVDNQVFNPSQQQLVKSLFQKSHYQFTKVLLLFENWPMENNSNKENKKPFFKKFNSELRYAVSILSHVLANKDSLTKENYKIFRDMLQKAVRLNLKMNNQENQLEAKSSEIYAEISSFTQTIRLLLQ